MNLVNDCVKATVKHYKKGDLNWPMIIYITLAHWAGIEFLFSKFVNKFMLCAAVIGLFTIPHCNKFTLLWAFILWPIRFDCCKISAVSHPYLQLINKQWQRYYCRGAQALGPPILQSIFPSESISYALEFDCKPRQHLALGTRPSRSP